MKAVAVFGASGKTGRVFINSAVKQGIPINAFCRGNSSFPAGVNVVQGSFTDSNALDRVLREAFAVFCAIGSRPPYKDLFCAIATRSILEGMSRSGLSRMILLTGAMIGDEVTHLSTPMKWLRKIYLSQNAAEAGDRREQEELVVKSALEWTVIKPPRLSDSEEVKEMKAGQEVKVGLFSSVTRKSLADFVLGEFLEPRFVKKKIWIKNQ